jgi:EmrB/QacA subfamily drug resistance transporter
MALFAMSLAVFAIAIDSTALSVALPQIEGDFKVTVSSVQWVINAYGLVFGVLIIAGGRLADMFGRKRIFLIGAAGFAAFSVLGGAAQSAAWLIAARALMGIGAALMWPATLGMTFAALPERRAGLAGGLILGVAGIGNALGPLIGGALTEAASWRWVLFLNLPVAIIAGAVTAAKVHQPHARELGHRIDYGGIATLCGGCFALLLALEQAGSLGFGDAGVILLLAAFVVLIASFVLIERRMGNGALVPPDVARNHRFVAACAAIALLAAGFFTSLLYLPQFMQKMLGYSALQAGVGLLPMMLAYGTVSFLAGTLYRRLGAKLITSAGAACMTLGLFLLSLVTSTSGYGTIVAGMVVFGTGLGLFISSATTVGITTVDPSRMSLAGGTLHMLQLMGGAIGLGLATSIFTSAFTSSVHSAHRSGSLTTVQEHAVNAFLAGSASAQELARRFPDAATAVDRVSRAAFAHGMQASFRVTAALAAAGFVVAVGFVGGRKRRPTVDPPK